MLTRYFTSMALLMLACRPREVPAPPPPPPAAPVAAPASVMGAIVGMNVLWGDALVRGDSAALASAYTEDAVLMNRAGDVSGKAAIVATLLSGRRVAGDTIYGTATDTDQLDVAGDRAYEAGTLTYTLVSSNGTPRKFTVRYANFWQLDAGSWKLRRSLRPLP